MYGAIFLLSRWLLPDRSSAIEQMGDPKEYTIEMEVGRSSGLAGKTLGQAGFTSENDYNIIEIIREGEALPTIDRETEIKEGDRLIFVGGKDTVSELQRPRA